jgi:hypothetical protein
MLRKILIAMGSTLTSLVFAEPPVLQGTYESGCQYVGGHAHGRNARKSIQIIDSATQTWTSKEVFFRDSKCISKVESSTQEFKLTMGDEIKGLSYGDDASPAYEVTMSNPISEQKFCFFVDFKGFSDGASLHVGSVQESGHKHCRIHSTFYHPTLAVDGNAR